MNLNNKNMEEIKKTSLDWYTEIRAKAPKFVIIDADGWDRRNYQYSFNEELVTKNEFQKRMFSSTVIMDKQADEFLKTW